MAKELKAKKSSKVKRQLVTKKPQTNSKKSRIVAKKSNQSSKITKTKTGSKAGLIGSIKQFWRRIKLRQKDYLRRRPHRTMRLTMPGEALRPWAIEGYFSFSKMVTATLWRNKWFFLKLLAAMVASAVLLIGLAPQSLITSMRSALDQTIDKIDDPLGEVNRPLLRAGLLFRSLFQDFGLNQTGQNSTVSVFLLGLLLLIIWLTVVWYLRNTLAGHEVKLRDSLYQAGAPIVPTVLVLLFMLLQLIPAALFMIVFSAAQQTDFLTTGIEGMVFASIAFLVVVLTLYWMISTVVALIVVTLPGMYPMKALRISGDLVVGRRLKLLLRMVWHAVGLLLVWLIILIPLILLLDNPNPLADFLNKWPVIQSVLVVLSMLTVIWTSVYVYFLYRRLIEDGSKPA